MATDTVLDGYTTLTGESLIGALNALDTKLPKGAYKQVDVGGKRFTDISPAYSLEEISNHFGPLGIGWGYEVLDEHEKRFATSKGKSFAGVVLKLRLWYAVLFDGNLTRVEWESYGGNANAGSGADEHFSWQGALTNAIGKGWSMQGFQRTIYKGEDFAMTEARDEASTSDTQAVLKAFHEWSDRLNDTEKAALKVMLGDPKTRRAADAAWIAQGESGRKEITDSIAGKAA